MTQQRVYWEAESTATQTDVNEAFKTWYLRGKPPQEGGKDTP